MEESSELKTLEGKTRKRTCKWILVNFFTISYAMRAGRLHLQGGQLVGTPISLAWRADASPALPLGPLVSWGCCGRRVHDLLSGSLIFVPPFATPPSFIVENTCIPSSMGVVWGSPHTLISTFGLRNRVGC